MQQKYFRIYRKRTGGLIIASELEKSALIISKENGNENSLFTIK